MKECTERKTKVKKEHKKIWIAKFESMKYFIITITIHENAFFLPPYSVEETIKSN